MTKLPDFYETVAKDKAFIDVHGLTKVYDGFTAVRGIDFQVEQGEIFGFLGPNGAGKTTTINVLIGLAKLTSGAVSIAGHALSDGVTKIQAEIGVIPDDSNLYEEMDGFENLCFCGSLYGMKKAERTQRARALLDQFGLSDAAAKPFKAYSKGMKRKLTIAAGLMHHPRILFLDEPTTGIDVPSARQIRQLLAELNRQGTTIFLTTHYIEEAERLCHRIALLVEGQIVKIGSPAELMAACQQEHIIQITTGSPVTTCLEALSHHFPGIVVNRLQDDCIRLHARESQDIAPFVAWLHQRSVPVLEARLIRPSLEDAFVALTHIDVAEMKMEKEGKKR